MRNKNLAAGGTGVAVAVLVIVGWALTGQGAAVQAAGSAGPSAKSSSVVAPATKSPATSSTVPSGSTDSKKAAIAAEASKAKPAQKVPGGKGVDDSLTSPGTAALLARILGVSTQKAAAALAQLESSSTDGQLDPQARSFQAVASGLGISAAQLTQGLNQLKRQMVGAQPNRSDTGRNLLTEPGSGAVVGAVLHVPAAKVASALARLAKQSGGSLDLKSRQFVAAAEDLGVTASQLASALDFLKKHS